jgi:exosome complex component RRP42
MTIENERAHLIKALEKNVRYDGRKTDSYRSVEITYDISQNAEGSASIKLGETQVLAGVKFEIDKPFSDTPDEGILMVNVELSPMASPEFESGPPDNWSIELARVVDRGIRESKVVDFKELCITPGEKVWMVNVDIVALNDSGNLLDACSLAAIAAIKNALFPEVVDGKVNYSKKSKKGLKLKDVPLSVTVHKIGEFYLVDPISEEEKDIEAMVDLATSKAEELRKLL